jgi:hypothetical protein
MSLFLRRTAHNNRLGETGRLRSGGVRRGGLPPLARSCVV